MYKLSKKTGLFLIYLDPCEAHYARNKVLKQFQIKIIATERIKVFENLKYSEVVLFARWLRVSIKIVGEKGGKWHCKAFRYVCDLFRRLN